MFFNLQQRDTHQLNTGRKVAVGDLLLSANTSLLLSLIIISTLSGVVLIA
jgi:hypothetical protein